MVRLTSRLISLTTTLCLSVGIHNLLHTKSANSRAIDQAAPEIIAPVPLPLPDLATKPINESTMNTSRISQQAIVRFPEIGDVRVCAHEDFGNALRLTFTDQKSEKEIRSTYFGNSNWSWSNDRSTDELNPKLRFKTISVRGFPKPLVIGIAMNPGVSDSGWEAAAVGVVNGELELLTFETMETSNDGGFFFGDLGHGLGLGAAQWDFVWGEDEGHPPPHKYEIRLYKWNGRRFEWLKFIRTRRQYDSSQKALSAYGFNFVDVRRMFPEWSDIGSW
jgi:hypothetical protein